MEALVHVMFVSKAIGKDCKQRPYENVKHRTLSIISPSPAVVFTSSMEDVMPCVSAGCSI